MAKLRADGVLPRKDICNCCNHCKEANASFKGAVVKQLKNILALVEGSTHGCATCISVERHCGGGGQDVINRPLVVDVKNGSQHLTSSVPVSSKRRLVDTKPTEVIPVSSDTHQSHVTPKKRKAYALKDSKQSDSETSPKPKFNKVNEDTVLKKLFSEASSHDL